LKHPSKKSSVRSQPLLADLGGGAALSKTLEVMTAASAQPHKPVGKPSLQVRADQRKAQTLLQGALKRLSRHDFATARPKIQQAVDLDPSNVLGWRMLAMVCENLKDYVTAFSAYEVIARLEPNDVGLMRQVGMLASKIGKKDLAIKLLEGFLVSEPDHEDATCALAGLLRDKNRYGDAVDLLRNAIQRQPERAPLWNSLGLVLNESGDPAGALVFYDEAIRLDPRAYYAHFNRAESLGLVGDTDRALADLKIAEAGLTVPKEIGSARLATAFIQLLTGDLAAGFESYEARFAGSSEGIVRFGEHGAAWKPGADLSGKSLLVYGEQGLGDEILFANVVNSVLEAIGPDGRLFLAVEPRLVALFQRSFPRAVVMAYEIKRVGELLTRSVDLGAVTPEIHFWAPIASLFRGFRTELSAFPQDHRFLVPDQGRVDYWRQRFEGMGPGPYVGIIWKSMQNKGTRQRHYSPFDLWERVLQTQGVRFINIQYGDSADEMAEAKARGYEVWTPSGIDLKMDIDDLAALSAALDLVIGPATATTNISAAVGTKTWFSAGPGWWPCFGSKNAPCYPVARVFHGSGYEGWGKVMEEIATALETEISPVHSHAVKAG
jgi:Tfp pilus assembly protein PilF